MAEKGYWADQFRKGAAEAIAFEWAKRLDTIERVTGFLESIEPSALMEKTGGKYGGKDIGAVIVSELKLVQMAIEELEGCSFPLANEMLSGLWIEPNKKLGVEKWSFGLANHMSEIIGDKFVNSEWWKKRAKEVRREAVKFNVVKTVTKS